MQSLYLASFIYVKIIEDTYDATIDKRLLKKVDNFNLDSLESSTI
jgi:hypothetical protein